jgi:pimeloyl-ACP methyl ester carboxylesterase
LAVRDFGSGRDVTHTLVLLHGLCLSQDSWTTQIRYLMRRFGHRIRVISYDHRGHGGSSGAPIQTYKIDRLGADLAEVLAALDITGPLTLAGHSMGGMAALAYLARPTLERPIQPDGLVLIATAAGKLAERGLGRLLATPATAMLCELASFTPSAAAKLLMHALARPLCVALNTLGGHSPVERQILTGIVANCLARTPLNTAIGFLPGLRDYDTYHALPSISARTVVVSGGTDILIPTTHALDLETAIAGAMHLHLPTGGHMLLEEAPQLVYEAINLTIGRSQPTTRTPSVGQKTCVSRAPRARCAATHPPGDRNPIGLTGRAQHTATHSVMSTIPGPSGR